MCDGKPQPTLWVGVNYYFISKSCVVNVLFVNNTNSGLRLRLNRQIEIYIQSRISYHKFIESPKWK